MATTTTITKLLFRRGNDSDREQTILASGEPGWTLDTKRLWVGDGVTPGGYPALSAREDHLHYVDTMPSGRRWTTTSENNFGGAQFLDINIPGISNSLAGESITDENQRWFHPVNRDITTSHDMQFVSTDAEISHTGSGVFKISKSSTSSNYDNSINIGDAIFIRPDGRVDIKVPDDAMLVFDAASAVFDNGRYTHFEDKSIDFNVVYDGIGSGREFTGEGHGAMSEDTGIYFAHNNYLSAGFVKIGSVGDETGWSTMELSPTVYLRDWEHWENDGFVDNVTRRAGALRNQGDDYVNGPVDGTYTESWVGAGKPVGSPHRAPKPLVLHSVRPSLNSAGTDYLGTSFDGNAHLVFEAGLIVYDAGDPTTGNYNAYKLNQSLDTRAIPTFAGIKIEKPDGTPGDPMGVSSGGTGVNSFEAGGVLYTSGKHTDAKHASDLLSMSLQRGDLMVGTTDYGVVKSKFDHNEWIHVSYDATSNGVDYTLTPDGKPSSDPGRRDGVIYIGNKFAPDYLKYNAEIRQQWFARWSHIKTDNLSISAVGTAEEPRETATFRGDYEGVQGSETYGGTIRTEAYNTQKLNERGVKISHNNLAEKGFSEATGDSDDPTTHVGDWDLAYFRGDSSKLVKATTMFAGLYKTTEDRYFGDLVPTDQTTVEKYTPQAYRNNGMSIGGVTVNEEGHVLGIRSKDFDIRYPQLFHIGNKAYRSSKGNGLFSPNDFDQNVSIVRKGTDASNRSEEYLGFEVNADRMYLHHGGAAVETTYYKSKDEGESIDGYEYESDKDTHVITSLIYNDYGTIKDFDTKNLNEIFYDKQQISVITDWVDYRLDGHDTWMQELSSQAFLRDKDTHSAGDKTINTKWLNNSKVWFRGATTGRDNKIWATDSDWNFQASNAINIKTSIGNNKSVSWIQGSKDGRSLMSINTSSDSTNYDTQINMYYQNVPCVTFEKGKLHFNTAGSTALEEARTTIGDGLIQTEDVNTDADVEVGKHLYVGLNRSSGQDSFIYFTDSSANDKTTNYIKYDDGDNRLETNSDLYLGNNLTVNKSATVTQDLTVKRDVTIENDLVVSKESVFKEPVTTMEGIQIGGIHDGVEVNPEAANGTGIKWWNATSNAYECEFKLDIIPWAGRRFVLDGAPLKITSGSSNGLFVDSSVSFNTYNAKDAKISIGKGNTTNDRAYGWLQYQSDLDQFYLSDNFQIDGDTTVTKNLNVEGSISIGKNSGRTTTDSEIEFHDDKSDIKRKLIYDAGDQRFKIHYTPTDNNLYEILHIGNIQNVLDNVISPPYITDEDTAYDSDRLGGLLAEKYSLKTHNHNGVYVKNAGDTMTGNLHFELASGFAGQEWVSPNGGHIDWKNNKDEDFDGRIIYYQPGMVESNKGEFRIYTDGLQRLLSRSDGLFTDSDVVAHTSFSDERLKKNITSLDSEQSLEKVLELSGVSFEWKDAPGKQIGLIAQQVEKVVPEVIDEKQRPIADDNSGEVYKRVDYEKLVPLLIESIKSLSAKVDELERKLDV